MTGIYRILDFNTIVASVGLVMATMSFMTGLQTVKRDRSDAMMMVKLHRFDGYVTCLVYLAVAGLVLIILKILMVRNRKYCKYASRLGIMLFLSWLFIIYQPIT